jgi:hypothetical protein
MRLQRFLIVALVAAGVAMSAAHARAQSNPFAGTWNITGDAPNQGHVYWLEVKDAGGTPTATFLNRGGSPVPVKDVKIADNQLTFTLPGRGEPQTATFRADGGKLTGTIGAQAIKVTGVRPPTWGACDANATHTFGKPWCSSTAPRSPPGRADKDKPSGLECRGRAMTNVPHANNLVSRRSSRISASRRVQALAQGEQRHLSPRPLRDAGLRRRRRSRDDAIHGHMAIYARTASDVNASSRRRVADRADLRWWATA